MNKLKELWSKAVFRWCVYQIPLLVFGLLLKGGVFDFRYGWVKAPSKWYPHKPERTGERFWEKENSSYEIWDWSFREISLLIWILILALPAVWVWRKPIWKLVKQVWKLLKQALGFLNKKAEEDYS